MKIFHLQFVDENVSSTNRLTSTILTSTIFYDLNNFDLNNFDLNNFEVKQIFIYIFSDKFLSEMRS